MHADAIFRHLMYKLSDRERAKELTQEVFLKTWQYAMTGKKIEHEKAFLYRIARNLFINEIRTDKKTLALSVLEEDGYEVRDTHDSTTESYAEHQELMEHLNLIKESYKEVLLMRYIDDLPVQEIAAILNENETNVSMRIKRATEALRATYNEP